MKKVGHEKKILNSSYILGRIGNPGQTDTNVRPRNQRYQAGQTQVVRKNKNKIQETRTTTIEPTIEVPANELEKDSENAEVSDRDNGDIESHGLDLDMSREMFSQNSILGHDDSKKAKVSESDSDLMVPRFIDEGDLYDYGVVNITQDRFSEISDVYHGDFDTHKNQHAGISEENGNDKEMSENSDIDISVEMENNTEVSNCVRQSDSGTASVDGNLCTKANSPSSGLDNLLLEEELFTQNYENDHDTLSESFLFRNEYEHEGPADTESNSEHNAIDDLIANAETNDALPTDDFLPNSISDVSANDGKASDNAVEVRVEEVCLGQASIDDNDVSPSIGMEEVTVNFPIGYTLREYKLVQIEDYPLHTSKVISADGDIAVIISKNNVKFQDRGHFDGHH